jgi:hypothetical protein
MPASMLTRPLTIGTVKATPLRLMDTALVKEHAAAESMMPKLSLLTGHLRRLFCPSCDQIGHLSRDCPEPKKFTGECFNCGEVGHNKADCPNPKVARPFTGECRICKKEGHPAAECPDKPADKCRICGQEGT